MSELLKPPPYKSIETSKKHISSNSGLNEKEKENSNKKEISWDFTNDEDQIIPSFEVSY